MNSNDLVLLYLIPMHPAIDVRVEVLSLNTFDVNIYKD